MHADITAALSQAQASIGHAVEVLDDTNISGEIRDDAAMLVERIQHVLNEQQQ